MEKQSLLKELGRQLRAERERQGYTQEGFAHHANLDRSYYGSIERGERNVTICTLCQVALKLGCDIAHFTKDMPTPDRKCQPHAQEYDLVAAETVRRLPLRRVYSSVSLPDSGWGRLCFRRSASGAPLAEAGASCLVEYPYVFE